MSTTALAGSVLTASSLALALSSAPVAAQEVFDWSGFYVGGGVGVVQSSNHDSIVYDGGGLTSGWTAEEGVFTGEIYRVIDNAGIIVSNADPYDLAYDDYELSLDELDDWATEAESESAQPLGVVWAGGQWHMPDSRLVLGGEFRASFGSYGSTLADSWSQTVGDSGTATCETDDDDCTVLTTLPHPLPLLPGLLLLPNWSGYDDVAGAQVDSDDEVDISGSYTQAVDMSFGTSYDRAFSALARVGVAVDRVMIYGVAGPTVADVAASTSLTVTETGVIDIGTDQDDFAEYMGEATYEWSGSFAEQRVGLTVGAGVDYAVTDSLILRAEASYTNMGDISVTGASSDTDATYTISQKLGAGQVLAGASFKF